jgi:plasmid stabilization system protein ParE
MQLVVSAAARADLKAIARFTERKWTAAQAKT